jgi:hypothetical protein
LALVDPAQEQSHCQHDKQGQRQVGELNIPKEGLVVYLRGYGLVRLFALVDENMEHAAFWATDNL